LITKEQMIAELIISHQRITELEAQNLAMSDKSYIYNIAAKLDFKFHNSSKNILYVNAKLHKSTCQKSVIAFHDFFIIMKKLTLSFNFI
jgi:hypothetical protein